MEMDLGRGDCLLYIWRERTSVGPSASEPQAGHDLEKATLYLCITSFRKTPTKSNFLKRNSVQSDYDNWHLLLLCPQPSRMRKGYQIVLNDVCSTRGNERPFDAKLGKSSTPHAAAFDHVLHLSSDDRDAAGPDTVGL